MSDSSELGTASRQNIDHDGLFKELLSTFFWEFLELFVPEMTTHIAQDSLGFMDKEIFTDVIEGDRYQADLLVRAQVRNEDAFILVHLEHQAQYQKDFDRRMFRYFARLYESHGLPVYPIALFSFVEPKKQQPNQHRVSFPHKTVLQFDYDAIQLNRLNWRDFLENQNPVATALMARMNIAEADRLRVKVECLRLLVTLRLNPAKTRLISGFIDTYLRLSREENQQLKKELATIEEPEQQEAAMQLVTSWMEEGIEQGLAQGRQEGRWEGLQEGRQEGRREGSLRLLLRQLNRRLGSIDAALGERLEKLSLSQVEELGEELFSLASADDVGQWLDRLKLKQRSLQASLTNAFGNVPEDVEREVKEHSLDQLAALEADLPNLPDLDALKTWLLEHSEGHFR